MKKLFQLVFGDIRNVLSVLVALAVAALLARAEPGAAGPALVLLLLAAAWWQAAA